MKKSRKVLISLIIIVLLLIIGILVYYFFFKDNNRKKEVKIIKTIPSYGYKLKENETELYKEKFEELSKLLSKKEVDDEKYAILISELFIIDFYTLDNKLSKNDIGGLEFIKSDMKDNFIYQARSTFYKYLEVKTNKRSQELPIVSSIKDVTQEKATFTIKDVKKEETPSKKVKTTSSKGKEVDAYNVNISWDYEEDLGYETKAKMILIKEDKKLYIVEMD